MEKPQTPTALPSSPKDKNNNNNSTQKRKLPTPQDLISHYESQGLETHEASIKVIEDLQKVLFRTISSGRGKKDKFMAETSRKLDIVHTRLAVLELKLDSKPGYAETLALGVAAGGVLKASLVSENSLGSLPPLWNITGLDHMLVLAYVWYDLDVLHITSRESRPFRSCHT